MKISNRENFNIEISRFYFYSQIMNQFNYHPIMIYLMKYIQISMHPWMTEMHKTFVPREKKSPYNYIT